MKCIFKDIVPARAREELRQAAAAERRRRGGGTEAAELLKLLKRAVALSGLLNRQCLVAPILDCHYFVPKPY